MSEIDAIRVRGVEGTARPSARPDAALTTPWARVAFLFRVASCNARRSQVIVRGTQVTFLNAPTQNTVRTVSPFPLWLTLRRLREIRERQGFHPMDDANLNDGFSHWDVWIHIDAEGVVRRFTPRGLQEAILTAHEAAKKKH